MDKWRLRQRLKGVVPDNRKGADELICARVISHPVFMQANTVYLFLPAGEEPNVESVLFAALEAGKTVALPVVEGARMRFVRVDRTTEYVAGAFGIREPKSPYEAPPPPDLILTPMVSYDERCGRLGHGKGYYDRFFYETGTDAYRLGVCYRVRKSYSVFSNSLDVSMDEVISEEGSEYADYRGEI